MNGDKNYKEIMLNDIYIIAESLKSQIKILKSNIDMKKSIIPIIYRNLDEYLKGNNKDKDNKEINQSKIENISNINNIIPQINPINTLNNFQGFNILNNLDINSLSNNLIFPILSNDNLVNCLPFFNSAINIPNIYINPK